MLNGGPARHFSDPSAFGRVYKFRNGVEMLEPDASEVSATKAYPIAKDRK